MAKGSVRKRGKKWYYRFYIEDESGNLVQKEFPGTESKSETESLLRKAMEEYEEKKFVAKPDNLTLSGLLDLWVEEELKPGNLSNGTFNPMQYVVWRSQREEYELFADEGGETFSSHCGLLRHAGEDPQGGKGRAEQEPPPLWRVVSSQLLR
jgi:hypothetical protein